MSENNSALLEGIKVLELTTMVFGPAAGVVLSDFGADVIKIEPPVTGDLNRNWHKIPGLPISEIPYAFQMTNRNKNFDCCPGKCDSPQPDTSWLKDCQSIIPDEFLNACSKSPPDCDLAKNISSSYPFSKTATLFPSSSFKSSFMYLLMQIIFEFLCLIDFDTNFFLKFVKS